MDNQISTAELHLPDDIGERFPFFNREDESKQLADLTYDMEKIRTESLNNNLTYDQLKRGIVVPVTMGLSGLGKTTFARRAIMDRSAGFLDENTDSTFRQFIDNLNSNCLNIRVG